MTHQGGAFRMRKPIMIHALFLMIAFFIYIQSLNGGPTYLIWNMTLALISYDAAVLTLLFKKQKWVYPLLFLLLLCRMFLLLFRRREPRARLQVLYDPLVLLCRLFQIRYRCREFVYLRSVLRGKFFPLFLQQAIELLLVLSL